MPQIILYLLIGAFIGLNALAKWLAKGAGCSNLYLRNGVRVVMVLTILFSIFYALYFYQNRDVISFDKLMREPSIEKCQNFVDAYPNSKKTVEVINWIKRQYEAELYATKDSLGLSNYIDKYSNNYRYREIYKRPYIEKAIAGLNLEKQRLAYLRNERIKKEQKEYWGSDMTAWQTASKKGTLNMYQQYLKLYPNGKYKSQAMKKIIDLEVADVFNGGEYGRLPSMNMQKYGKDPYTIITVKNDTDYALTLLYSGVESLRVVINPHGTRNVKLKSGSYRIVASVDANGVRNFAGLENLVGGSYSVSYYISTSRY